MPIYPPLGYWFEPLILLQTLALLEGRGSLLLEKWTFYRISLGFSVKSGSTIHSQIYIWEMKA